MSPCSDQHPQKNKTVIVDSPESIFIQLHALLSQQTPSRPMLTRALEELDPELWASGHLCPPERAVMLTATSKRVRALLVYMNLHLPTSVSVHRAMGTFATTLPRLCAWCRVVSLDMSGCGLGFEGAAALPVALEMCTSLTSLNLENNRIAPTGATSVARVLRHSPSLTRLDLYDNFLGAAGASSVAGALSQCPSLASLFLGSNRLGDRGTASVAAALAQCPSLASLNLFNNRIGDDGAESLAGALWQCSSLTLLSLRGNDIRSTGAASLVRGVQQCPGRVVLNMSENSLSHASMRRLEQCSSLRTLIL